MLCDTALKQAETVLISREFYPGGRQMIRDENKPPRYCWAMCGTNGTLDNEEQDTDGTGVHLGGMWGKFSEARISETGKMTR